MPSLPPRRIIDHEDEVNKPSKRFRKLKRFTYIAANDEPFLNVPESTIRTQQIMVKKMKDLRPSALRLKNTFLRVFFIHMRSQVQSLFEVGTSVWKSKDVTKCVKMRAFLAKSRH